jgi:ABC-type hemin transport system ATPase subunit
LFGPNGAGKSTLTRIISDSTLHPPPSRCKPAWKNLTGTSSTASLSLSDDRLLTPLTGEIYFVRGNIQQD